MKRIISRIFTLLAIAFVGIQFFHPKGNLSNDQTNDISKKFLVPPTVQATLKTSCYDCHSNNTVYPWYSKIQPVDWWLNDHVQDGKGEVNFNEFASYSAGRQYRKFFEIGEQLEKGEMPLGSYTLIHKDAIINETQKSEVLAWVHAMRDSMKLHYPADSLKGKKPI